ncbi:uncharacterized protein LOC128248766 [Octopus bimaculoides]|uniref:uncharacterized protein LOC128248766 n=1 Tax=Octopus bimaculoides TaxID=37653 RepID=UPI0022E75CBF|nr:uncharacterized protein LOC128248766 [Octopus bimaculoides]
MSVVMRAAGISLLHYLKKKTNVFNIDDENTSSAADGPVVTVGGDAASSDTIAVVAVVVVQVTADDADDDVDDADDSDVNDDGRDDNNHRNDGEFQDDNETHDDDNDDDDNDSTSQPYSKKKNPEKESIQSVDTSYSHRTVFVAVLNSIQFSTRITTEKEMYCQTKKNTTEGKQIKTFL